MKDVAIIYDLDDTILPTRSIPQSTFQPIFNAIENANHGTLSKDKLKMAFDDLWCKPIDIVQIEYGFNKSMIIAGKNALLNTDYKLVLKPFDDFPIVKEINCKRFLVTTGVTKLQQAKINALFKTDDFDEIIIDDPYKDKRLGKKHIFTEIANRHNLKPNKIWIIGDNPDSEIEAGNQLGMKTVQIIRPGIKISNKPNYIINSFHELKKLVELEENQL